MIVKLENQWNIEIEEDKGLRYLASNNEVIVLDDNHEVIVNIQVQNNGNIKIRNIGYRCDFEIGNKVVYVGLVKDLEPEITSFSTSFVMDDGSLDGLTNKEKIEAYLSESQHEICDDCLSMVLSIEPRQQVNQICNGMKENNEIIREKGICMYCDGNKLLNKKNLKC